MKKIYVNLKDWLSLQENINFAKEIKDLDIVLFPAMAFLYIYKDLHLELGTQDVSSFTSGAHTGSISATHLKDLNIGYVILNHNELRIDDNNILYDKVVHALEAGLKIMICINDTNEKELNKLKYIFENIENTSRVSVAYEPAMELSVSEVKEKFKIIKKELGNHNYESLIYGGSVSPENIQSFESHLNVQGYLISRHALNPDELKNMIDKLK